MLWTHRVRPDIARSHEGTFLAGHNPRGMAIVLFNPETEEGFATVTLFAIPLPMSLLLVLAGLVALPLCRRP